MPRDVPIAPTPRHRDAAARRRDALPIVERGARATSIDAARERAMALERRAGARAARRKSSKARLDDGEASAPRRRARGGDRGSARTIATIVAIALCGVVAGTARAARPMTGGGGETPRRTRAERALEAWETKTALERALRHPQNDLEVDGACGMVLKKQCSHVRQARDLAAEAWRRVRYEEELAAKAARRREKKRTMTGAEAKEASVDAAAASMESIGSVGGTRSLLARRGGSRASPSRGSRGSLSDRMNRGRAERESKEEAKREKEEAEAQAKQEVIERAEQMKFDALKSFPKGTLANDPEKLENDIAAVEAKLKEEPDNVMYQKRLQKLNGDKKRMINAAGDLGFRGGALEAGEQKEDHWFMNDDRGGRTSYRNRNGRRHRAPQQNAKDMYDHLMKKIPVISRSYFDCVEYVIKSEEKVALETFMEFGKPGGRKSIITKECHQEYKAAQARVYEFWHAEEKVKDACEADIKENCGGVQSGYGLITSCLWDVKSMPSASLAKPCEESLNILHVPLPSAQPIKAMKSKQTEEETHVEEEKVHVEAKKVHVEEERPHAAEVAREEAKRDGAKVIEKPQLTRSNRPTSQKSGEEPEKVDQDVKLKLREAEAKIQLAEDAAAHSAQQSRNLVIVMLLACALYAASRKTVRKKFSNAIRKLRRDSKGEHLG